MHLKFEVPYCRFLPADENQSSLHYTCTLHLMKKSTAASNWLTQDCHTCSYRIFAMDQQERLMT